METEKKGFVILSMYTHLVEHWVAWVAYSAGPSPVVEPFSVSAGSILQIQCNKISSELKIPKFLEVENNQTREKLASHFMIDSS